MPSETPSVRPPLELVFGLVAPVGVDLTMVSEALDVNLGEMRYSTHVLRITKLMYDVAVEVRQEVGELMLKDESHVRSYQERIAYANAIRNKFGNAALSAVAISAIRSFRALEWRRRETAGILRPGADLHPEEEPIPFQAYIIRQLKRPEEVARLREVYGPQFVLISAYAPQRWRVSRIEQLEKDSRGGLISDIEAHNRARALVLQDAKESQDSHGQNVRDAFPMGDVFIDATSRVNCEAELRRFIHLLFGNNQISPTHDEYGAYLAKSASLRSSDLSRQVGAAIFRASGEVITLGCNEVPKAGGGTYWAGDDPDQRDFVKGSDPNEVRKLHVLVDLIDRLRKGGYLSKALAETADAMEISRLLLGDTGLESSRSPGSWISLSLGG